MQRVKNLLKKAFTPITIMFIPHSSSRSYRIKIPSIGIILSVIGSLIGTFYGSLYVYSIAVDSLEYDRMKPKFEYYTQQFMELKSTIRTLKRTEDEFKELFLLKTKEEILEKFDDSDTGSIDLENLKHQIKLTMETVGGIKDYLSQEKDVYLSTPLGWPIEKGRITSAYGRREHPKTGKKDFHSGIDLAAKPGTPVKATADGIVTFAGWGGANGNLVVLEHGFGYSTFYAHNKKVIVKVGDEVRRGDIISNIGSTGNSTGPHVHYEVWKDKRRLNPYKYLKGRS
jgi:murein DD-endopeptidase MepM/ murein hydrolase activator NlpD